MSGSGELDGDLASREKPAGCARIAREIGEDLVGTAPSAAGWVVIEQPGPFGRDALFESRLPGDVARGISDSLAGSNTKIVLVRRTVLRGRDTSPSPKPAVDRAVWWTWHSPDPTLYRHTFTDPDELRDLDWSALRDGRPDQVHQTAEVCRDPLLLLCTNGRRDVCCAALARPVAVHLARDERYRNSFMESSHLGGHRFAPGALQLPQGWAHGRLDAATARGVLDAARAGRVQLDTARGRSELQPMAQVAELAVRRELRCDDFGAVSVTQTGPTSTADASPDSVADRPSRRESTWDVTVAGVGRWTVVVRASTGQPRPESCGADPVPVIHYETRVEPAG